MLAKIVRCDCCGNIIENEADRKHVKTAPGLDFCTRCKRDTMELVEKVLKNEWQRQRVPIMIIGPLLENLTLEKMQELAAKQKEATATAGTAGFA